MERLALAGSGFLLAVLWFDLMFDVQARGREDELPESTLASIAAYYRRVTTAARPMNRLVAVAMLATLVGIGAEIGFSDIPPWVGWVSLAFAAVPMAVAGFRTVPHAVRLGARGDDLVGQTTQARSIRRDHLGCLVSISALLVVQLVFAS